MYFMHGPIGIRSELPDVSTHYLSVYYKVYQRVIVSDDLFNIKFVQPSQQDTSQRLRAGQDNHRRCTTISNQCPKNIQ